MIAFKRNVLAIGLAVCIATLVVMGLGFSTSRDTAALISLAGFIAGGCGSGLISNDGRLRKRLAQHSRAEESIARSRRIAAVMIATGAACLGLSIINWGAA